LRPDPHAAALAARNKKARERHLARARWRSFAEYTFLEDSRYASQRKNVARRIVLLAGVTPVPAPKVNPAGALLRAA